MDAVEFYHQASAWYADGQDQRSVTARSVVSRSYYAAFLVARDHAGITSHSDVHKQTIEWYRNRSAKDVIFGNKLDGLRILRVRADYDMNLSCLRREAGDALKRSKALLVERGVSL